MRRDAIFDPTGRYRYALLREWQTPGPELTFVMLNPSAADAERDDPTIRRCIAFARSWGYGRLRVLNLFAYRTHDPRELAAADDPVGPDNDAYLASIEGPVVAGWGNHGTMRGRDRAVLPLLGQALCLGLTKCGQPRHPLYLPGDARPRPWREP